jgi:beta-1,4-mannosyl-glycoprotein beta-1,4-N-acetylglucosaminyltransferase
LIYSVFSKGNRKTFTTFFVGIFATLALIGGLIPNPILIFQFSARKHQTRRVFDCFLYNGESMMLYIRLWRLSEFVDHFILFMSNTSFTGKHRELSFEPYEDEIMKYRNKIFIINKEVTIPENCTNGIEWCREESQRNGLIEGVNHYHPQTGDLIFVSDVDEIMTKSGMIKVLNEPPQDFYNIMAVYSTPNFLYGNKAWDFANVIRYTPQIQSFQWYRENKYHRFPDYPIMTHCSYCFKTIEEYKFKLNSFSHQEYNRYPYTNESFIYRMHYCRQQIVTQKVQKRNYWFDNEDLIPPDPGLQYLIDPHFTLDRNQTIYNESILPHLCKKKFSFFESYDDYFLPKKHYVI